MSDVTEPARVHTMTKQQVRPRNRDSPDSLYLRARRCSSKGRWSIGRSAGGASEAACTPQCAGRTALPRTRQLRRVSSSRPGARSGLGRTLPRRAGADPPAADRADRRRARWDLRHAARRGNPKPRRGDGERTGCGSRGRRWRYAEGCGVMAEQAEVETLTIRIPMRRQRRGGHKLIMTPEGATPPSRKTCRDPDQGIGSSASLATRR
jgi:hypothetical protein